jgi:hypothetical protein
VMNVSRTKSSLKVKVYFLALEFVMILGSELGFIFILTY